MLEGWEGGEGFVKNFYYELWNVGGLAFAFLGLLD